MTGPWILRSGANRLGHGGLLSGSDLARLEARATAHGTPELEVRAMHDDSILVAIEAALSRSAFCNCGTQLHLVTHDGAAWLECVAFERPSRLPSSLALLLRELTHDREHVVDLPEAELPALAA